MVTSIDTTRDFEKHIRNLRKWREVLRHMSLYRLWLSSIFSLIVGCSNYERAIFRLLTTTINKNTISLGPASSKQKKRQQPEMNLAKKESVGLVLLQPWFLHLPHHHEDPITPTPTGLVQQSSNLEQSVQQMSEICKEKKTTLQLIRQCKC